MNNSKGESFKNGIEAEKFCIKHLEKQNYEIIAHRFKSKNGEIDIIAKDNESLIIIEVKYRKTIINQQQAFDDAINSISKRQRLRIANCLNDFLAKEFNKNNQSCDISARFDIICVTGKSPNFHIYHIENAWWSGE